MKGKKGFFFCEGGGRREGGGGRGEWMFEDGMGWDGMGGGSIKGILRCYEI